MEQSIEALPRQCRIIFRLIKEDGIKYKEFAEILNISPRTVQTQLFRAMKKLSVVLSEYCNPASNASGRDTLLSIILLLICLGLHGPGQPLL
jgi:DNA-binding CsgD family transcriptional regulator